jgi:hypothetical protein
MKRCILLVGLMLLLTQASASYSDICGELESSANELRSSALDLARCADSSDFSDDCSRKFRDVRYAFDEYESAVSEANNELDDVGEACPAPRLKFNMQK